jgi:metallo-beta-lactamase family protein
VAAQDVIQLSFHGATGTVTGSKYLVEANGDKVLVDCGMFQGARELRLLNWNSSPFNPAHIKAVILTHTHVDHIGYLPRLVKHGFKGKVYATAPTIDLAAISLLDSAHLQMEDATYRTRKKITRHKKALPLYDNRDAERAIRLLSPVPFNAPVPVTDHISFHFQPAGHILGAAGVFLTASENGRQRTIMFSGDVGRYGNPLVINPAPPPECDYLVCESTYGGRIHKPEDPYAVFEELINDCIKNKSVLLIPAFAVSRTQQIIYLINNLIRRKRVAPIAIHIDSPMAISVTDIYCKYHDLHELDSAELDGDDCVLEGNNVFTHRDRDSSKSLNELEGPAIIISASGMMVGGRIMHHLINRLPDPSTTVLITGFMAAGTIGRKILEGEKEVYIHKRPVKVNAKIKIVNGLSGHADYNEILHWLEPVKRPPRKVFITHGEKSQSEAMADHIRNEKDWECYIPVLDEVTEL